MSTSGVQACGFAALIGAANAGKSTLLNALIGSKLSIVTHKVQTTRARLRGIAVKNDTQIIFVDTPGIFAPKKRLEKAMVAAAWAGVEEADAVILIVDVQKGMNADLDPILTGLEKLKTEPILVLNKIDKIERPRLLDLSARLNERKKFAATFMISALNGDGVADLLDYLACRMPACAWLYPPDQLGDISEQLLACEITREKIFLRLHEELPYTTTVETESFKTLQDGSHRIEQVIYVSRPGHRAIILGKGGATIKALGQSARLDMEKALGARVHLFLRVKLMKNWTDDPERYREMGLEFPKG